MTNYHYIFISTFCLFSSIPNETDFKSYNELKYIKKMIVLKTELQKKDPKIRNESKAKMFHD